MAKRTAIIDIGSNSISLVIYEKSSRYAFHLIEKIRSKVRIGEGAYENGGRLSDGAMDKAYHTLEGFLSVIRSLKCKKVLTVATSALRDAPNKKDFLKKVRQELGLNIKVIDGKKEAYLGALAAINLLPEIKCATTIDIGGGSTDIAKIVDGKIVDTISLDLGTVRLKELFFDKKKDFAQIQDFIDDTFKSVPKLFNSSNIIGIGGTIRALSSAILKDSSYPISSLHAFEYSYDKHKEFIENIAKSEVLKLRSTSISANRYDTIRQGSSIFFMLCERLEAKDIIISKAGVREGVYLSDILRNSNYKFPHNFNVSIRNLVDRFAIYNKNIPQLQSNALVIYEKTYHLFDVDCKYKDTLKMASKLLLIFKRLNIYSNSDMSFGFLVENLNFALSHSQKILIALILKYTYQKNIDIKEIKKYKKLLPCVETIEWLSFILSLTVCINRDKKIKKIEVEYQNNLLTIVSENKMFLSHECVKKLKKPASFVIVLKSSS